MPTGYFNPNQDPCIDIEVSNPIGWKKTLACLIDTGFTGFLSIPMFTAFPIGLLLSGTMSLTMADGSTQYRLTCLGTASLENESQVGVIIIEPSSDQVLLGLDFLRKFSFQLIVNPIASTVELTKVHTPSLPFTPPSSPSSSPAPRQP